MVASGQSIGRQAGLICVAKACDLDTGFLFFAFESHTHELPKFVQRFARCIPG